MSQFSDDMAQVALDLISEFGEDASFERTVQGAYDPESGDAFSATTTLYSGMVVPNSVKEAEIDGTIIQRGDLMLLAHQMNEVPMVGDEITLASGLYRILNVKKTVANGADCLYALQVRA